MKINDRLMMIANKIPYCRILTDVGTDHAYIPIYAVKQGLCFRALAVDLRRGPLKAAHANIKRHGLEKSIETRLGNGLESIMHSECDVIVIAGVGGLLISDILSVSVEKARKAQLLLLQPNSAIDVLRRWLYENGFEIVEETLKMDAGKIYCLVSAKWTDSAVKKDEFVYYFGEKLFAGNNPLLQKYLEIKLKELDKIIEGRSRSYQGGNCEAEFGIKGMDTATCVYLRNKLFDYLKDEKS